jgi:tripartite-type tricarboxylate transporter receptor subunit TctC
MQDATTWRGREINVVLADSKVKEKFANLGGTTLGGTPADFAKRITDEIEKWGKVIRTADIKLGDVRAFQTLHSMLVGSEFEGAP